MKIKIKQEDTDNPGTLYGVLMDGSGDIVRESGRVKLYRRPE